MTSSLIFLDRVMETTAVTSTAPYKLNGPVLGYQAFSKIGDGNTCYYAAWDGLSNWEVGLGTYTLATTTLARTTIEASSNNGSPVSWPLPNTKYIWLDFPANLAATTAALSSGTLGLPLVGQGAGVPSIYAPLPLGSGGVTGVLPSANGGYAEYATRSAMSSSDITQNVNFWLSEGLRAGPFMWVIGNQTANIAADPQQGVWVQHATIAPTVGAFKRIYTGALDQYMFGALGGGADDTVALQASINYAAAGGSYAFSSTNTGLLLVWKDGNHLITSTITVTLNCDLSAATLSVHGLVLKTGVYVGTASAGVSVFGINCRLPRVINIDKPATGWTGVSDSFGIIMSNLDTCQVFIPFASGFGVNVLATAFSTGNAYNEIDVGILYNGQSNLRLQAGDLTGYVNENNWYGGRYTYNSAEGTQVAGVIDIEILEFNTSSTIVPDHNVFYKPSIETQVPIYNAYIQGTNNRLFEPRYEGPATIAIYSRTNEQSVGNSFIGGMDLNDVAFVYLFGAGATETRYNGVVDNSFMILEGSSNATVNRPTLTLANTQTGGSVVRVYDSTAETNLLTKTQSDTTYSLDISATALIGKIRSDASARLKLDFQGGSIQLLNGAGTDGATISQITGNGLGINNNWNPTTDIARNLGAFATRWLKGWFQNISLFPPASVTPANNGEMTFQLTSNTALAIKVKGSDGTVRTGTITLS